MVQKNKENFSGSQETLKKKKEINKKQRPLCRKQFINYQATFLLEPHSQVVISNVSTGGQYLSQIKADSPGRPLTLKILYPPKEIY